MKTQRAEHDVPFREYIEAHFSTLRQFLLLDGDQEVLEIMSECYALMEKYHIEPDEEAVLETSIMQKMLQEFNQKIEHFPSSLRRQFEALEERVLGVSPIKDSDKDIEETTISTTCYEHIMRIHLHTLRTRDVDTFDLPLDTLIFFLVYVRITDDYPYAGEIIAKTIADYALNQECSTFLSMFLREYPISEFNEKQLEYIFDADMHDPEIIYSLVDWVIEKSSNDSAEKLEDSARQFILQVGNMAKDLNLWPKEEEFVFSHFIKRLIEQSEVNQENQAIAIKSISDALLLE